MKLKIGDVVWYDICGCDLKKAQIISIKRRWFKSNKYLVKYSEIIHGIDETYTVTRRNVTNVDDLWKFEEEK